MAVYDLRQQRLCVRVVYDGPAGAGKTTNVQQLGEMFAAQAVGPRPRPDDHHQDLFGRTLTFDWEQLNAGVAGGLPLQCQIVSVPGQHALAPRRRALLAAADVVVYVCDGAAEQLTASRRALTLLEELTSSRERPPPIVLQVNKQDGPNALDPEETARLLGLPTQAVIGAVAVQGKGVMDTFIAAVRAVGHGFQAAIDSGTVRVPIRAAERPGSLAASLEALPLDADDAAEMLLEELLNRFGDEEPVSFAPLSEPVEIAPPALPLPDPPAGFVWPPILGRDVLRGLAPALAAIDARSLDPRRGERARITLGPWSGSTSRTQRYVDEEAARLALASLARSLPPPESDDLDIVIALALSADGGAWLWTLERALSARPRQIEADHA